MPFDLASARKEGSDKEIVEYLASKTPNFDLAGARKEGSDKEIAEYLASRSDKISVTKPESFLSKAGSFVGDIAEGVALGAGDIAKVVNPAAGEALGAVAYTAVKGVERGIRQLTGNISKETAGEELANQGRDLKEGAVMMAGGGVIGKAATVVGNKILSPVYKQVKEGAVKLIDKFNYPATPADISHSKTLGILESVLGYKPLSGDVLLKRNTEKLTRMMQVREELINKGADNQTVEQFGKNIKKEAGAILSKYTNAKDEALSSMTDDFLNKYGSLSKTEGGEQFVSAMSKDLKSRNENISSLYNQVKETLPQKGKDLVPLSNNIQSMAKELLDEELSKAPAQQNSKIIKTLQDFLPKDNNLGLSNEILNKNPALSAELKKANSMTWDGIDKTRGQLLENRREILKATGGKETNESRIYSKLSGALDDEMTAFSEILGQVEPTKPSLYHYSETKIKGSTLKAGSPHEQNYFGDGVYLTEKGQFPGKFEYQAEMPQDLKILDLTSDRAYENFRNKISKEIGIPIKRTGQSLYDDFRYTAAYSKNEAATNKAIKEAVANISKGYDAIKAPYFGATPTDNSFELILKNKDVNIKQGVKEVLAQARDASKTMHDLYDKDILNVMNKPTEDIVDRIINKGEVTLIKQVKDTLGESGLEPIRKSFFKKIIGGATGPSGIIDGKKLNKTLSSYGEDTLNQVMSPEQHTMLKKIGDKAIFINEKIAGMKTIDFLETLSGSSNENIVNTIFKPQNTELIKTSKKLLGQDKITELKSQVIEKILKVGGNGNYLPVSSAKEFVKYNAPIKELLSPTEYQNLADFIKLGQNANKIEQLSINASQTGQIMMGSEALHKILDSPLNRGYKTLFIPYFMSKVYTSKLAMKYLSQATQLPATSQQAIDLFSKAVMVVEQEGNSDPFGLYKKEVKK